MVGIVGFKVMTRRQIHSITQQMFKVFSIDNVYIAEW